MERDRKRAQCLFRTQSLGKKSLDIPEETSPVLGNFEPDWSKFESVYANGKYLSVLWLIHTALEPGQVLNGVQEQWVLMYYSEMFTLIQDRERNQDPLFPIVLL